LSAECLNVVIGGSSSVSNTLPRAIATHVPWHESDLKHPNNEVFYAIINKDGFLLNCEVFGEVQVNSRLSGAPDLIPILLLLMMQSFTHLIPILLLLMM